MSPCRAAAIPRPTYIYNDWLSARFGNTLQSRGRHTPLARWLADDARSRMHRAVVTITRWCGTAAVARRRPLHLADDEAARQAAGAVRCTTHGESGTEGERTRCEPRAPRTARARWTRRTRRASARRSPPWMGPAASRERKEKIEADCPSAHGGARFIQVSSEAARVLTTRKVRHRSASTSVRSGRSARITGSTSFFRA